MVGKPGEERWVRTDEAEDVAASIRHSLRSRDLAAQDPQAWKWVALALHSALQGACVCHLVTTANPIGAVTTKNAGEWLQYFEASRTDPEAKPPTTYLLSLPDLLTAVRKPRSAGDRSNPIGVVLSDEELEWLRRFHREIRNQFVHFEPRGWSLEVSGMPDLAKLIARLIGEMLEMGWAFRHQDADWRRALRSDLAVMAGSNLGYA
ncbi:MAG: hypothetical protein QOH86_996 [Sphingomonadales bacterium]|jgi:hypothetical protein|nr:hypothetical protein [Sphingomonadales bacterium]